MNSPIPINDRQAISVLLVDDSPIFLHLTKELLERQRSLRVVASAFTGEEAFVKARRIKPWVIIIDLDMQIFTNPQAISYLRSRAPAATIIALTLLEDAIPARLLEKFGVDMVIKKSCIHLELVKAIQDQIEWIRIVQQDTYLNAVLVDNVLPYHNSQTFRSTPML
jgi:DNA-binding NarL/FixJ family response regulator